MHAETFGTSHFSHQTLKNEILTGVIHIAHCKVVGYLTATGPVDISHTMVHCPCSFTGVTTAHATRFNNHISSCGPLTLQECKANVIRCVGPLSAHSTHIDEVEVTSTRVDVRASRIMRIFIRQDNESRDQILNVSQGSRIEEVIFESGRGLINCDTGSFCKHVVGAQVNSKL